MTAVQNPRTEAGPPAIKPGGGAVRGWFGRLPWPARAALIVLFVVLAYLLP